jgi:hypothetical protein
MQKGSGEETERIFTNKEVSAAIKAVVKAERENAQAQVRRAATEAQHRLRFS